MPFGSGSDDATLFAGTVDGVWCLTDGGETVDRVLAAGSGPVRVWRVVRGREAVYAATDAGLFRSTDEGYSWEDLSVPTAPVFAVAVAPDGTVHAGTHPPRAYTLRDGTWTQRESLRDQPSREKWDSPVHDEGQVRHLEVPPSVPDRLVAGVERGGVHVSDDRGTTWAERRDGVHDDVHHLEFVDADTCVAATGAGLYRTDDAGRSWTRLDGATGRSYFRETLVHDGRLYAAATAGPSTTWRGPDGADAALFESDDGGETLRSIPYPGGGREAVLAWAVDGRRVLAGTDRGRVLVRRSDGWETLATVPAGIRSMTVV